MSLQFPVVPAVAGVPDLQSFPGVSSIVGSIQGQVLTVTSGYGALQQGLALAGNGIAPGTVLTSGLTAIQTVAGGSVAGIASVNIAQTVPNVAMQMTGSTSGLIDDGSVLTSDRVSAAIGASAGPQWGIFLDGEAVLVPDSIVSFDYKKDWHISDYPVELGNFESYNKVRLPFDARLLMTKGGEEADRAEFLARIEQVAASLDLYDVVTPERTYSNANVLHFDYRRTSSNGVSLLTIAVWLQEVRVEASSTFTNTASPVSADQVNTGTVQPQSAPPAVQQLFRGHGASGSW